MPVPIGGERPAWLDELEYTLAWQGGKLTPEQMENVGYELSTVPADIMWAARHTPIVGEGIGKHLRELTAMYLQTSGLAEAYKPRPELASKAIVQQQDIVESEPVIEQKAPKTKPPKQEAAPEPTVSAQAQAPVAVATEKNTSVFGVQKALKNVYVFVCDRRRPRSSFTTKGLTPAKDTSGKVIPGEYVVDKKFIERLGNEFFKAKIQTRNALSGRSDKELKGIARTLAGLSKQIESGEKVTFSVAGLRQAEDENGRVSGTYVIDEAFVERVGSKVFNAPEETKKAYAEAQTALDRSVQTRSQRKSA